MNPLEEVCKIRSKANNILDIGCGIPTFLFESRVNIKTKYHLGIEQSPSEKKVIRNAILYSDRMKIYNQCSSFMDCYSLFLRMQKRFTPLKIKSYLNEYKKRFRFKLGRSFLDVHLSKKFDIILCMNVLHFIDFETSKSIISKIYNHSNLDALIVISVNHADNHSITKSEEYNEVGSNEYECKTNNDYKYYLYSEKQLRQLMSNNFRLLKIDYNKSQDEIESIFTIWQRKT